MLLRGKRYLLLPIYNHAFDLELFDGYVAMVVSEAATGGVLLKKMFLKISQNSKENTCASVSFLIKKGLWHRCFPVNFAKYLRTPFLKNTSGRLLL